MKTEFIPDHGKEPFNRRQAEQMLAYRDTVTPFIPVAHRPFFLKVWAAVCRSRGWSFGGAISDVVENPQEKES